MEILAIKTSIFKANQSLFDFIKLNVQALSDGDVLVITSKLVALSEGRVGKLEDKEKIIRDEAEEIIETPWAFLTLTERGWEINAGVDESNADDGLILMPKDSFSSAELILRQLKNHFGLKNLGVIITDSKSLPLRLGTVGRMVGCAGFVPTKSYLDQEDLFGRKSRMTISNVADALSSAAVLVMGEGDEQSPLSVIKQAPVVFIDRELSVKEKNMQILPEHDIFSYVYKQNM